MLFLNLEEALDEVLVDRYIGLRMCCSCFGTRELGNTSIHPGSLAIFSLNLHEDQKTESIKITI